jgi:hypothetical protein
MKSKKEAETMNISKLTDDELRAQLFDRLAERLQAEATAGRAHEWNRKPTEFAISANGSSLMGHQGEGQRLLRGEVKWKHREDGNQDQPWLFTVARAADGSRLQLLTKGSGSFEGSPEEVVNNIVTTFLTHTGEA